MNSSKYVYLISKENKMNNNVDVKKIKQHEDSFSSQVDRVINAYNNDLKTSRHYYE